MTNPSPQDIFDTFNEAYNQNDSAISAGRSDAIYHVGMLIAKQVKPSVITKAQTDLADPSSPDYSAGYHLAYLQTWNVLHGLMQGIPLKALAREHG